MPLPFTTAHREQRFWRWFQANSERLFDFERDREAVFKDLTAELRRVHRDLTFEFGPVTDGKREFIISAGGIHDAFPAVRGLTACAPSLSNWAIIPFRPPKSLDFTLKIGGREFTADDMWFEAFEDEGRIALALYLRGYTPEQNEMFGQAAFILLDCALGEYAVETQVGGIEFRALPEDPAGQQLQPLRELRAIFDTRRH